MRCEVVGDPPPTRIRWFKNEAPLEEDRPKITIRKIHAQTHEHAAKNLAGSRLKITNLDVSDVGFYTCRVTNGKDQIQSEGTLRVDSSKKWQVGNVRPNGTSCNKVSEKLSRPEAMKQNWRRSWDEVTAEETPLTNSNLIPRARAPRLMHEARQAPLFSSCPRSEA
ncbi:Tyrosine-protein kinase transmembrane receptor ROR1 [Camponotus floridanus]|uniref:Tyrosine-protein kinase transmembrane receptor ROR1 n=1 Tax=Camponotus floridanus TaxID=104421 RepID=E2A5T4_CAMFO|nr:Tyrosine-protein kinase transmembrane receptor ROR1 [Camponotus floridanus]